MPAASLLRKLRWEDQELKVSLDYDLSYSELQQETLLIKHKFDLCPFCQVLAALTSSSKG